MTSKNKKPIDEAFEYMLQKLKADGFKKLTRRIMVKETEYWLYFVQFTSILQPCKHSRDKEGYGCEVGAFLKGASHYSGYNGNKYKGYPANDAVDCHFRRRLKPPFAFESRSCGGYFHARFWWWLKGKNLNVLSNAYDIEVSTWVSQLEDLKEVGSYVQLLEKSIRGNQNINKWGRFYRSPDFLKVLSKYVNALLTQ